jgi:subtilase family serine protease
MGRPKLILVAVLVCGVAGSALCATSASAQPASAQPASAQSPSTPGAVRVGARPVLPPSARDIGRLAPSTRLRLDVTLKVRQQAALTSLLADLSDRRSPLFHHFLRPGQFGAEFGATRAQLASVEAALRSAGLKPGPVDSGRLAISVQASAAAVERAFGTSLVRYRLDTGRIVYANTKAPRFSAGAARYVSAVVGLDSLETAVSLAVRPRAESPAARAATRAGERRWLASRPAAPAAAANATGPRPCRAAVNISKKFGSLTASEFARGYGFTPLYTLGDLGQGVHVGLIEFEPNSPSDISAYLKCYAIHTAVDYVKVDGGSGRGAGTGEAALDIEDVAGLAPDATIDVYQAPNSGTGTFDDWSKIVGKDKDKVISTSWGLCEPYSGSSFITAEEPIFEQAASQGQTILAAAGDDGSTGCLPDGPPDAHKLAVLDPASQPHVIGVGGTSITSSGGQVVWNNSSIENGAGGGGLSVDHCMPSYQDHKSVPGLISKYSKKDASKCGKKVPYLREVPDVSADANPETGYVIYHDGGWLAIGGTSAAAPLWAAAAAITDASPFCKDYAAGAAGVQPPGLYEIALDATSYIYRAGHVLTDITSGNNDYTPSGYKAGLYPATKGYDMATGLGTPIVGGFEHGRVSTFYPGLAALMCYVYGTKHITDAIKSLAPSSAPAGHPVTVAITGQGFLPIKGADLVVIGNRAAEIYPKCTSFTKCTVRLPAHAAGTVSIYVVVEDVAVSNVVHFRYR